MPRRSSNRSRGSCRPRWSRSRRRRSRSRRFMMRHLSNVTPSSQPSISTTTWITTITSRLSSKNSPRAQPNPTPRRTKIQIAIRTIDNELLTIIEGQIEGHRVCQMRRMRNGIKEEIMMTNIKDIPILLNRRLMRVYKRKVMIKSQNFNFKPHMKRWIHHSQK